MILRGGKLPDYDTSSVDDACALIARAGLSEKVMIDVSHVNSDRQAENQPCVIDDLAGRMLLASNASWA